MLKFKDLSLVEKVAVVVWSVSCAAFTTYCVKATKAELDEIKKLNEMIADDAQKLKDGLY